MKTPHIRRLVGTLLLSALLATSLCAEDDIAWKHRATQGAVMLTANPLGSASRSAFYTARGFAVATIEPYARACGFSFGMRNGGATAIVSRISDWHVIGADGGKIALRLPEAWDAQWEQGGVSQAARIAFRWAQFQAENTFEPGDWIMGMVTLTSVPNAPFRLVVRYRDAKGTHEIILEQLACADD